MQGTTLQVSLSRGLGGYQPLPSADPVNNAPAADPDLAQCANMLQRFEVKLSAGGPFTTIQTPIRILSELPYFSPNNPSAVMNAGIGKEQFKMQGSMLEHRVRSTDILFVQVLPGTRKSCENYLINL